MLKIVSFIVEVLINIFVYSIKIVFALIAGIALFLTIMMIMVVMGLYVIMVSNGYDAEEDLEHDQLPNGELEEMIRTVSIIVHKSYWKRHKYIINKV